MRGAFFMVYLLHYFKKTIMKSMLIAVLFTGGVIAGLILYGSKKIERRRSKNLTDHDNRLLPSDGIQERNPVHSMG